MAKVVVKRNPMQNAGQITRTHVDLKTFVMAVQRAYDNNGTCESVAKELGISEHTVYQKLAKYRKNPAYAKYLPNLPQKTTKRVRFEDEETNLAILKAASEVTGFKLLDVDTETEEESNGQSRVRAAKTAKK